MLRRPRKNDPRADPFWEFGSFGCTSCHAKNLLHPKNSQIRDGDRLAFVQGGQLGPKLLLVTPPVERVNHPGGSAKGRVELRWDANNKPFRYDRAPALFASASPGSPELFPRLTQSLTHTNRTTIDAKLASRFRARTTPLAPEFASEVAAGFSAAKESAGKADLIASYEDALPWCDCPTPAGERRGEYQRLRKSLGGGGGRPEKKRCG